MISFVIDTFDIAQFGFLELLLVEELNWLFFGELYFVGLDGLLHLGKKVVNANPQNGSDMWAHNEDPEPVVVSETGNTLIKYKFKKNENYAFRKGRLSLPKHSGAPST